MNDRTDPPVKRVAAPRKRAARVPAVPSATALLATTAVIAAIGPKLPPFHGD